MTSRARHQQRPSKAPSRWLAALLVGLICYGATVEAAHRHNFAPAVTERALGGAEDGDASGRPSAVSHNCLLCQFQSQLSFGLIHLPALTAPPASPLARADRAVIPFLSQTSAPRRSRAPPLTSPF